jgi:predicted nucleic acid-binding protein
VGSLIDTSAIIAAERGEIDLDKLLRESVDDDVITRDLRSFPRMTGLTVRQW